MKVYVVKNDTNVAIMEDEFKADTWCYLHNVNKEEIKEIEISNEVIKEVFNIMSGSIKISMEPNCY